MERKSGGPATSGATSDLPLGRLKVRRHSRSQSDLSQLDNSNFSRGPFSPALARPKHSPRANNSPLNSPLAQVSPRSPRLPVSGRPSRDRLAQESKKKRNNDSAAAERVFVQLAMAGNGGNNNNNNAPTTSADRRYVDNSQVDSVRRSHRRAVSLSVRADSDGEGGAGGGAGGEAAAGVHGDMPHKPARRMHSTMRPSRTPASSSVLSSSGSGMSLGGGGVGGGGPNSQSGPMSSSVTARRKAERFLSGKLLDFNERLGHRRANSWDPRNEDDELSRRKKSEMTTLEAALATRKAELAAKERMLMERQSRQEAELMSLAGATNMEKELQELLRLQRKLKSSPERHAILAQPVATPPPPSVPMDVDEDDYHNELERDDVNLMQTLNDLSHELRTLKQRTLRIENRVKELRCPGPTPLEMMTGGATFSQAMPPGPSSASEGQFSTSLPQHARRVEARRSPVDVGTVAVAGDRVSKSESPSGVTLPGFAKQPSFNSAFAPVVK